LGSVHEESLASIWARRGSRLSSDPELDAILDEHEVVATKRLGQIRSFRKGDARGLSGVGERLQEVAS
jgi:hypothetical protein